MKSTVVGVLVVIVLAIIWLTSIGKEGDKLEEVGLLSNSVFTEVESGTRNSNSKNQSASLKKTDTFQEAVNAGEKTYDATGVWDDSVTKPSNFLSEEALNKSFLTKSGAVIQTAIVDAMKSADFNQFLSGITDMERSSRALSRENKLQLFLQESKLPIYQESYACSGRICGVMLMVGDDTSDVELKQLHLFETNYSFYNITRDESGNKVLKAVFIETEDPSNLTFSQ
ncbi:hypothetical protein [Rheinheimera sp. MMS21-TC3]|uniref:hypothetical protein n=1 Tax=Rheinheimera sp. MMS21-TC3 TaxID=3072790 RepID=UPI0028C4D105|nr:hypothetical protein [Rheinheimera sp. MMS21-TC3]WNO59585.1 hypothetical protein RDV63_01045 [Rheinheimera sp. MMS21-TC3]